jgi:hypothetical protein
VVLDYLEAGNVVLSENIWRRRTGCSFGNLDFLLHIVETLILKWV